MDPTPGGKAAVGVGIERVLRAHLALHGCLVGIWFLGYAYSWESDSVRAGSVWVFTLICVVLQGAGLVWLLRACGRGRLEVLKHLAVYVLLLPFLLVGFLVYPMLVRADMRRKLS